MATNTIASQHWETETMHAHGWSRTEQLATPACSSALPGLAPRG
ncbi:MULTISPECIES: hypothetical protein [Streptomyces]|nr:hypothetical protein [Streptomyces sp. NRRL S-146]